MIGDTSSFVLNLYMMWKTLILVTLFGCKLTALFSCKLTALFSCKLIALFSCKLIAVFSCKLIALFSWDRYLPSIRYPSLMLTDITSSPVRLVSPSPK